MKRQVSLEEISDGRLYGRHDMVRVGCGGCRGCSVCCHGMGNSAILDPLDVHRLLQGTGQPIEALLTNWIELNVVDGVILPNLKMSGENEACGFLTPEGRCGIHSFRPGVCRLFPLGRYYEREDRTSFHYFLQVNECPAPNKTKIRVEKWLEQPDLARYEEYILKWHNFLEQVEDLVAGEQDETAVKNINLYVLKLFYMKIYDPEEDFYMQFETRLEAARDVLGM
ncbi:MAG: YkgJ family cysteine cluster protein [Lachnospiraceae bacterium]|nr:YkgJ family cysteine cluster protein [Lachnospiraceae bacterium]